MQVYHDFFLVPGSRSTFPDTDPDPDPGQWYRSDRIRIRNTGFKGARKTITFIADMIKQFRMHYKIKRSWNYLVNWWFYFFINIPKTLNWQFVQLDLEFSCIQRKSFCHYIPIWRRPIWMVVFTKQVSTKNLQLLLGDKSFIFCFIIASW